MAYAVRADIELIFGSTNVSKWADLNNDEDAGEITARIVWALTLAEERVNNRLRQGKYDIPFATAPTEITDLTARWAGVILYDSRLVIDGEDSDLSRHEKTVEDRLSKILAGKIKLSTDVAVATYPQVVLDG